jgi:hypothetical protein
VAEVLAVAAQAFEQQAAHRVEVDLVGLRGQQVLRLAHVLAVGHHLLAGRAQPAARRPLRASRRNRWPAACPRPAPRARSSCLRGPLDHAQQVAQLHFAAVAHRLGQRAAQRVGAELLDQRPSGAITSVVRSCSDLLAAAGSHHRRHHREQEQQAEEHQVEDQPAGEVHHVPQTDEETGDGIGAYGLIHGTLRNGRNCD